MRRITNMSAAIIFLAFIACILFAVAVTFIVLWYLKKAVTQQNCIDANVCCECAKETFQMKPSDANRVRQRYNM